MKTKKVVNAILAILGPVLYLLGMALESRCPEVARYCRTIGTATEVAACVVARV